MVLIERGLISVAMADGSELGLHSTITVISGFNVTSLDLQKLYGFPPKGDRTLISGSRSIT